jgi:cephalosporin hydroxylase
MKKYSFRQVLLFCFVSVLLVIGFEMIAWRLGYHRQVISVLSKIGLAPRPSKEFAQLAQKSYEEIITIRNAVLPPQQLSEFLKFYYELGVWNRTWWLGVKTLKNPCDMWMIQQIICEATPDYIIEAGTNNGGSALYFAQILDGLGLDKSKVITIDIEDFCHETAKLPLWKKKVEFIRGSSIDPEIVARIGQRVQGKKVLVDLDSDHHRNHVFQEMMAYAPMVTPGSYLVVEDTNIDGVPVRPDFGPGPMAAVHDFLNTDLGNTFIQDVSREAMILTFFPGGWLKKK